MGPPQPPMLAWGLHRLRTGLAHCPAATPQRLSSAPLFQPSPSTRLRFVLCALAREPHHCGGLLASGELFREVAEVLFRELLHAEPP